MTERRTSQDTTLKTEVSSGISIAQRIVFAVDELKPPAVQSGQNIISLKQYPQEWLNFGY